MQRAGPHGVDEALVVREAPGAAHEAEHRAGFQVRLHTVCAGGSGGRRVRRGGRLRARKRGRAGLRRVRARPELVVLVVRNAAPGPSEALPRPVAHERGPPLHEVEDVRQDGLGEGRPPIGLRRRGAGAWARARRRGGREKRAAGRNRTSLGGGVWCAGASSSMLSQGTSLGAMPRRPGRGQAGRARGENPPGRGQGQGRGRSPVYVSQALLISLDVLQPMARRHAAQKRASRMLLARRHVRRGESLGV